MLSSDVTTVMVTRIRPNVIAYTTMFANGAERLWRANRYATFSSHNGLQVHGAASTLWRADDATMLEAFKRSFPVADIKIV